MLEKPVWRMRQRRLFPTGDVLPIAVLVACLSACQPPPELATVEPGEAFSGGATSVAKSDSNAFSMPSANLSPSRRMEFFVGNGFFRNPWKPASAQASTRDGLGPLFNTDTCQGCHIKDGRGHPPGNLPGPAVSMLVRLSIPPSASDALLLQHRGVVPEPTYGGQLQDAALPGHRPEGQIRIEYSEIPVQFSDRSQISVRKPSLSIEQLGYGPMPPDTLFSPRIAPPMIGLGLLEAIDDADIHANAQRQAATSRRVRGKVNLVWDESRGQTVIGRFGWKAGQPSLNQQNAHALAGDMGLTSRLSDRDDCTSRQPDCIGAASGGTPEVSNQILASILFYTRNLAVPMRRQVDNPQVLLGKALFHQAGCAACHVPSYVTGQAAEPELSRQKIFPYTDLLLHDMGNELADGRSEYLADGNQWRTPPLWGIGLTSQVNGHTQFLHDGRARNLMEAIVWHGGEARGSRNAVLMFDQAEREALLAFLNSL
ncbi:di-heme oxidoredictase family protein [Pseudomonas protegens]|uniref:di-heme oxidoreductase family protein n=1 Tax=Pseudomonas protegens TaxID=380021 RepID=UPI00390583B5